MGKLNRNLILDTTEQLIYKQGVFKTTLCDIAKELGVSHPALYKHFKSKEDILQQLALRWLSTTSYEILNWTPEQIGSKKAVHDWLWLLASTKKSLYENDPKMFVLYTTYIESNDDLIRTHLHHLAKKAAEISNCDIEMGEAIIRAFTYFHNPYFASRWKNDNYKADFENSFRLISLSFN
ncbi:TetR/AcrR family transcriptional regulator [Lactococcus garvieae]|uniref:TetR/AcrR family transcriptional regulator n=1 Tax=Lactococcus garvieae TaxID=1363 RepID=UPI0038518F44